MIVNGRVQFPEWAHIDGNQIVDAKVDILKMALQGASLGDLLVQYPCKIENLQDFLRLAFEEFPVEQDRRQWASLSDLGFSKYDVSDWGEIINVRYDKPVSVTANHFGHVKVGLQSDVGHGFTTRSVAQLVAQLFLPEPPADHFDSIIHLNGDRSDCHASNLMWRPRWFSIMFHKQFKNPHFYLHIQPIVEIHSGNEYRSAREVCIREGLLYQDVVLSMGNQEEVHMTGQEFRIPDYDYR